MIEGSLTAIIAALKPGESYSRASKHTFPEPYEEETGAIVLARLRSEVYQPVARATRKTGKQYTIETGQFFTRSHVPMFVVVVTRTDDAEDLDSAARDL